MRERGERGEIESEHLTEFTPFTVQKNGHPAPGSTRRTLVSRWEMREMEDQRDGRPERWKTREMEDQRDGRSER